MSTPRHVMIFGGLGKVGHALVRQSVARGFETRVGVRRPAAAKEAFGPDLLSRIELVEVDSLDPAAVYEAMRGVDVAINAAGNSRDGELFLRITDVFMTQAERALDDDKRVWLMGGFAALDVPNTKLRGDELYVPTPFKQHRHNVARLRDSSLNWSMCCPGPMVDAYKRPPKGELRVSAAVMPVDFPTSAARLPKPLLTAAMFRRIPETRVSYDDVASMMLDRTDDPTMHRRRVGIALPVEA